MRTVRHLVVAASLLLAACSTVDPGGDLPVDIPLGVSAAAALESFDTCEGFLGHVKTEAADAVGPFGFTGSFGAIRGDLAIAESAPADGLAATGGGSAAPAFSTTNVQEAGVDEPDVVKTDGRHMYVSSQNRIFALRVTDGRAQIVDRLDMDEWGPQLFLAGDRLVVLAGGIDVHPLAEGPAVSSLSIYPYPQHTVVRVIDVSDPTNMREVSEITLEGTHTASRMVDGVVRVVLHSDAARFPFVGPQAEGQRAIDEATERNKQLIVESDAADWFPTFTLTDRTSGSSEVTEGQLASCSSTYHPGEFSGTSLINVITIDPADPTPREGTAILGGSETTYASKDNLYVTSTRWEFLGDAAGHTPDTTTTEIHRFDISDPKQARYTASGQVRGRVLNQFSLSEHDRHLRVATTVDRGFGRPVPVGPEEVAPDEAITPPVPDTESFVTVLRADGDALIAVGAVGDLGRGETIHSVRFIGDMGYVVTFRQIDPLYVIDLSDATKPRVRGELKIPGFSSYLHPISDTRLLGVGQDATADGRTTGTQVSLFDVSDPTDPKQVDKIRVDGGSSQAEYDHHAFLYWPATDLAVIPLQSWNERAGRPGFNGVLGITVDGDLDETARISHPAQGDDVWLAAIQRSVVIGDTLFTISELGVKASDLDGFADRGWVAFPKPPQQDF